MMQNYRFFVLSWLFVRSIVSFRFVCHPLLKGRCASGACDSGTGDFYTRHTSNVQVYLCNSNPKSIKLYKYITIVFVRYTIIAAGQMRNSPKQGHIKWTMCVQFKSNMYV